MNQIKWIQLGVIAICMATVPLSSGQTPRTRTSRSNQIGAPAAAVRAPGSSIGNSIKAPQIGINAGSTTNIGAHTATNVGAPTGINNRATGITGAATGLGALSGISTGATQTGINAATGTNTKANTNAGAQTGTAAGAGTGVKSTQPQIVVESTQLPTFSTPTPAPTPIPSPTPVPSPSFSPSPSPSP
jgi:hypothetical protein